MKIGILLLLGISLGLLGAPQAPRLYHLPQVVVEARHVPTPTPTPDVDKLIDTYSKKYGESRYKANRIKVMLHFLLLREQNYGGSKNCGDSGLACGPLQFHEGTYERNRKDMIDKGFVNDIGSRHDMSDAIETTAYMISIGQENQWGPVARGEIKL